MGSQISGLLEDENSFGKNEETIEYGLNISSDSSADSSSDDGIGYLSEKDMISAANDPFRVEKRMIAGSDTYTYDIFANDSKINPFFSMFFSQ